jgi:hypothetical protein
MALRVLTRTSKATPISKVPLFVAFLFVVAEACLPLPMNCCFHLLNYSSFQPSCHSTYSCNVFTSVTNYTESGPVHSQRGRPTVSCLCYMASTGTVSAEHKRVCFCADLELFPGDDVGHIANISASLTVSIFKANSHMYVQVWNANGRHFGDNMRNELRLEIWPIFHVLFPH